MTADEFRAALKTLGWSYATAARALGVVDGKRVGEWARGKRPVPPYIAAHVRYRLG